MKAKDQPGSAGPLVDVSEYQLERLAAGDLPPARAEALRARLAGEPGGRARLEQLMTSNEEILRDHPPEKMAGEIQRRLAHAATTARPERAHARSWPRLQLSFGLPLLAAAAVVVLVARGGGWHPGASAGGDKGKAGAAMRADDSGDTLKGLQPSLRVYRKMIGRVERLQDGAPTHAGDQLQVAYVAAGHRFGAVVSADGAGHVTFHLPAAAGPAVRLRTDGETALPSAYELDGAPGFERFVFIVSDDPFDASILADIASGRASPPAGKMAVIFTVRKP
jgi:hypothetical protein